MFVSWEQEETGREPSLWAVLDVQLQQSRLAARKLPSIY